MEAEKPLKPSHFAKMFGLNYDQIHRAIKKGIFIESAVEMPDGAIWILPTLGKTEWEKNHNKALSVANSRPQDTKTGPKPKPKSQTETAIVELKRQETGLKVQKLALELQRERGILVEKSTVYSALFDFGKEIRTRLLSMPDRIIDSIIAAENRTEAHSILLLEINHILTDVAEKLATDFIKTE